MYSLVWTSHFGRSAKKFIKSHPELKKNLVKVLHDLQKDPTMPNLHLHHLTGKMKGLYAISITHSYRITLTIKMTAKEIILLDIGSHDRLYDRS